MEIKKISEYEWEIPKTGEMKVPDKHKVFKVLVF